MSATYEDEPEDDYEGDPFYEDGPDEDDPNQCPECGDNLDFGGDGKGFCWSCDL